MKSLQAFWRWFDNEKPAPRAALGMRKNLSALGEEALRRASGLIHERVRRHISSGPDPMLMNGLAFHPDALRELSLSLCAALEKMHEQVPAPVPVKEWSAPIRAHQDELGAPLFIAGGKSIACQILETAREVNESIWHREYLCEWVTNPYVTREPG